MSKRLIYLLDADEKRRLEVSFLLTHLLNWKAFQPAPITRVVDLMQTKFRDFLNEDDRRFVMRLGYWQIDGRAAAAVAGVEAYELLENLIATGRAFWREGAQLRLNWGAEREAQANWENSGQNLWTPRLVCTPPAFTIIGSEPPCYVDRDQNVAGPLRCEFSPALASGWLGAAAMDEEKARAFCLRLMNRFPGEKVPLPGQGDDGAMEEIRPRVHLRLFRRDTGQDLEKGRAYSISDLALAEVRFGYGPRKIEWSVAAETIAFEEEGRVRRCYRHLAAEEEALGTLRDFGFRPSTPAGNGLLDFNASHFALAPSAPTSWTDLLRVELPRLRKEFGWEIEIDPALRPAPPGETDWFSRVARTREDWFSFETGIRYRGKSISVLPIIRTLLREHARLPRRELIALCRRSTYTVPVEGGKFLLLPGKRIADLLELLLEIRPDGDHATSIRIGAGRAAELADEGIEVEADELIANLRQLRRDAAHGVSLKPLDDLPELPVTPRDYQRTGLAWLDFLRQYNLGGILADDMGLGKTMQVLVHLLREKEKGRLDAPCLIVAPTSLLDSWKSELERFAPGLRLLGFHGAGRSSAAPEFTEFDVVITSYNLARIEAERLRGKEWSLIVLDEAQRIKNPDAETVRVLRSLPSRRRLCLTGTPIENHLGELWSLFHFLMPGYLGDRSSFTELFRKPVEGEDPVAAREAAEFLSRRLRPFILRRTKDQVALELPPRTEITRFVPLAPRQAELYESVRLRLRRELAPELERRGVAGSQIQVLDALLRLRQICCDPRLHRAAPAETATDDSAKLALLMEMLDGLLLEGRKVLIFSQFVSMLRLIATEFDQRKWKYLELTGATTERGKIVEAFQAGEASLFLLSLKAGGTGLTLTAADTVIQYDPWWNPAIEQQAADRVYRIGQDKPVFHYRLIAKGTVEEKILQLHERKRAIIDSILDGLPVGDAMLDEETIEAMLSPVLADE